MLLCALGGRNSICIGICDGDIGTRILCHKYKRGRDASCMINDQNYREKILGRIASRPGYVRICGRTN